MNGTSTYLEFDDIEGEMALHLPKREDDSGPLSDIAAMLFFAINDPDCKPHLDAICSIVSDKVDACD